MRLLNYIAGDEVRLGIKVEGGIIDVADAVAAYSIDAPTTMETAIAAGGRGLALLDELTKKEVKLISEDNMVYAPCVTNPAKLLCVGLNYPVNEGAPIPVTPYIFSKFNNALAAHKQVVMLPNAAKKIDFEAELVIIMGKKTFQVSKEDALSYVFGYTAGNDFTARDLIPASQLLGKTLDRFGPIGPYIVTADSVNPDDLQIQCEVNGTVRQDSNTSQKFFDCASIISYISRYLTLLPGDVIFTGTPKGFISSYPAEKQIWLKAGDIIKVTIEKIGTLTNIMAE